MINWWLLSFYESGGAAFVVSWVFWVFFSITLHELAHGWAALSQGDDTPRTTGHMTWNPLVHMPPMSIIMFIAIGITWGLMPVDPGKYKWKRQGRIVVASAGPAMNIALFILAMIGLILWTRFGPVQDPEIWMNFHHFFFAGASLNLVLALFNLLPAPPLDGSDILSGMSLRWYMWMQDPRAIQIGFFVILVIFLSPIGDLFWEVAWRVITSIQEVAAGVMRA